MIQLQATQAGSAYGLGGGFGLGGTSFAQLIIKLRKALTCSIFGR